MISDSFYSKLTNKILVSDLIKQFSLTVHNTDQETDLFVTGVANLHEAKQYELSFLTNIKYANSLDDYAAQICLTETSFVDKLAKQYPQIIFLASDNAYYILSKILPLFYEAKTSPTPIIEQSSYIAESAKIGENVKIAPGVIIHENADIADNVIIDSGTVIKEAVSIGANSKIGANSVISFAEIGADVEIANNVSIGQDGFGFAFNGKNFEKVIQLGKVIIADQVSIGAGVTIDRGSMENTVIGFATKIDNLVQIGHNVKIGANCLLISQVGVAGSTEIGDYVVLGGQVGVAGHLKIGSQNKFAAQAGITKNIPANSGDFYGMPAKPKKDWQKEQIAVKNMTKNFFNNNNE